MNSFASFYHSWNLILSSEKFDYAQVEGLLGKVSVLNWRNWSINWSNWSSLISLSNFRLWSRWLFAVGMVSIEPGCPILAAWRSWWVFWVRSSTSRSISHIINCLTEFRHDEAALSLIVNEYGAIGHTSRYFTRALNILYPSPDSLDSEVLESV